jgi:RNA polymerase sigma-70 factor, ECF subfamily
MTENFRVRQRRHTARFLEWFSSPRAKQQTTVTSAPSSVYSRNTIVTITKGVITEVHDASGENDARLAGESLITHAIAQENYREALSHCTRLYAKTLGRLCMAFTGSQAEAEELAQETLLAAYNAFPSFRGEGTVRSFLFGIARRKCARHLETRVRRQSRLNALQESEASSAPTSQELIIKKQQADHARKALEQLRPTEREALLLRYQSDLPFKEVALAVGCDEASARKRVSRALARLRDMMSGNED